MLASLLFPYDDDAPELIDEWLAELEQHKCIVRYQIDGANYIQICNWLTHQKIDKPTQSKLPEFVEGSRTVAKPREDSSGDLDLGSGPGREGKGSTTAAPRPTAIAPWFAEFKTLYPKRSGNQPWNRALKAAGARVSEGHTHEDFIAGARRYAAYCEATGKLSTELVMQAATFLGPDKPFAQDWAPPAVNGAQRYETAEERLHRKFMSGELGV
jgi:hypothetical protein